LPAQTQLPVAVILGVVIFVAVAYTMMVNPRPHAVMIVYQGADGAMNEVAVGIPEYQTFATAEIAAIKAERAKSSEAVAATLDRQLTSTTDAITTNIESFADWYFSWGNSQKMLFTAAKASVSALTSAQPDLARAAGDAMRHEFELRFVELVMKPDETAPRLEAGLKAVAVDANDRVAKLNLRLNADMARFAKDSALPSSGYAIDAVIRLNDDAGPTAEHGAISPGLPSMAGDFSALVHSTVIESAEKVVAVYSTMLVAPIVSMFSSAAATGTAAGGTAAITSAPVMPMLSPEILVATYALSFLLDYGLTRATDYTSRAEFVARTKGVLSAIRSRWLETFKPEFAAYVDILYDKAADKLDYEHTIIH
jgi:hypothetical protein